jgi:putative hydrolase of the HAD superfamily
MLPIFSTAIAAVTRIEEAAAFPIARMVRARYLDPTGWIVFPDSAPALATLSAHGWRHMVLSNHVPELPRLIDALGLGHHFERVFTSATLGYEKPNPLAFKAAVNALPSDAPVIMIGDSVVADYKGARAAGLDAILVRKSHPDCDPSCSDLNLLVEILKADNYHAFAGTRRG